MKYRLTNTGNFIVFKLNNIKMETKSKKGFKYKLGMLLLILMVISPAIALIIPYLGFGEAFTLTLQGILLVGGPEVFMIAGVALAGKEGLETIKNTVKKIFGLPAGEYTATKSQYNLGITMLIIGLFLPLISAYLPHIIENCIIGQYELYVNLAGDILIILGVFTAGQQFITKLKKLITWEKWELEKNK